MYKRAHQNKQARADGLTIRNLSGGGVDFQTPEQKIKNLKIAVGALDEQLRLLPKKHRDRPALAQRKGEIALELSRLRPKKPVDGKRRFFQIARDNLTASQFAWLYRLTVQSLIADNQKLAENFTQEVPLTEEEGAS